MHSARFDAPLALAWVPFSAVAIFLRDDTEALSVFVGVVLIAALAHQPLTLALVYGDPARREERRALYRWSPPILIAAIVVGGLVALKLVLLVALLWNLEHHVMQRFGIGRIYGRMGGDMTGGRERLMHWAWGITMLLWIVADRATPTWIDEIDMGTANRDGLHTLLELRPIAVALVVPALIVSAVMTVMFIRREVSLGSGTNPVKWLYTGSTFALLALFAIAPVAGLVGLAACHAIEYFVVVTDDVGRRYVDTAPKEASALSRLVGWGGRSAFLLFVGGVLLAIFLAVRSVAGRDAFLFVLATIGALHVLYDAFIWKRPKRVPATG